MYPRYVLDGVSIRTFQRSGLYSDWVTHLEHCVVIDDYLRARLWFLASPLEVPTMGTSPITKFSATPLSKGENLED